MDLARTDRNSYTTSQIELSTVAYMTSPRWIKINHCLPLHTLPPPSRSTILETRSIPVFHKAASLASLCSPDSGILDLSGDELDLARILLGLSHCTYLTHFVPSLPPGGTEEGSRVPKSGLFRVVGHHLNQVDAARIHFVSTSLGPLPMFA